MKIVNKNILEQNIDKLIGIIEKQTGKDSILYLELISVEIKTNSNFLIAGKGYNKEKYLENLKDHLRDKTNTSLLLLKHKKDQEFRFFHKKLGHLPFDYIKDKKRSFYSQKERPYHKIQGIEDNDVKIQWKKWIKMAHNSYPGLRHACFLHHSISVPVSQTPLNITSAVWVFFSKPISNIKEIEPTLRTGIYEYVIYTLLPEKVKQIERQDTFDALAHTQKQHIHALEVISERLGQKDKQILDYVTSSLKGFLALSKSYKERTLDNIRSEEVSISKIILNLVYLLENFILSDSKILRSSIKGNDNRHNKLYEKNQARTVFSGNFRNKILENLDLKMYVPQVLFKEAIVNALENANKDNPEVEINYFSDQNLNKIIISISNNGKSTKNEVIEMRNPQNPFKIGCRLINDFAKILEWQFSIESNYINKTTYIFII